MGFEIVGEQPYRRTPEHGNVRQWLPAAYLAFVIYGSLVPLEPVPVPLAEAWARFQSIEYLRLGVESRADWVANILLYIPLAYLTSSALVDRGLGAFRRAGGLVAVFLLCAVAAVAIEFAQLFFPPRTVSINDIAAESIGTILGIAIWLTAGPRLRRLRLRVTQGGPTAFRAAIVLYVLAYAAFSAFPFDFLVSWQEIAAKLQTDAFGWWVVPRTCARWSFCAAKLLAESVAVLPLGFLLDMSLRRHRARGYLLALLVGLAVGAGIEALQLLLASGVSEGASVVTRAAGTLAGLALHRSIDRPALARLRERGRLVVLLALPFYLVALAWANGWFVARWGTLAAAQAALGSINWLPFYYHYYTSETIALQSAIVVAVMYFPVGVGAWLWQQGGGAANPRVSAAIAGILALAMEAGKLFAGSKHADPTDVLIAMVSAGAAFVILRHAEDRMLGQSSSVFAEGPAPDAVETAPNGPPPWRALTGVLLLVAAGVAASPYPLGAAWIGLPLLLWAGIVWRLPDLALPTVLAALPVLNLGTWTGWVALNEADFVLAVTLGTWYLHSPRGRAGVRLDPPARFAVTLLVVSSVASAWIGIAGVGLGADALYTYLGGANALRVLKGFAWAVLLIPVLLQEADGRTLQRRMTLGFMLGLTGVVAVVVWERVAFANLLDLASDVRADGPFPELHVGGGDIHVYLVMALPFAMLWLASSAAHLRIAGGLAFLAGTYALAVTFARGGYLGYGVTLVVLMGVLALHALRAPARRMGSLVLVGAIGASLAVAGSILAGDFMRARAAKSGTEAMVRASHWLKILDLVDAGPRTSIFGMGLGSLPRTILFKDGAVASATFAYPRDPDGTAYLRLGAGRPVYIAQRVPIEPGERYALTLDVRSAQPNAGLRVFLCEKSLQASYRCEWATVAVDGAGAWQRRNFVLGPSTVGEGARWMRRPVYAGFASPAEGAAIDIGNVSLRDTAGHDLITNGDFTQGGARWTFAADDHLPWHAFDLWIHVLFEQGWFGIVAMGFAVLLAIFRLSSGVRRGALLPGVVLASLAGVLMVGVTESIVDSPRIATLVFVLLVVGMIAPDLRDPPPGGDPRSA